MKFNSVFFFCVLLCLILVSLSCSESKNAQIDRKFLELGDELSEKDAQRECSGKSLSEADCKELKEEKIKSGRKGNQGFIERFDENCKKSALLEDECLAKKQDLLKRMYTERGKY
jgi:hypothetical protein